jgi:hypothetical protein
MPNKPYKNNDDETMTVSEPAVAYQPAGTQALSSGDWNPNVPFCGTQEEWWEHFHRIEEEHFTPLEEANKEFDAWKKEFLASRLN